jgi:ubiquinone/menaquinone biosynthesis C-methylase UbiE
VRKIPTWEAYDRMALAGEYGRPLSETGELALSADAEKNALFFQAALNGRRRVLDLGCGPGFPLLVLADYVTMLCGMDASPAMLALARQNVTALQIQNTVLVRGLAEALPFADGTSPYVEC